MDKYIKDGYIFNTGPARFVCEWREEVSYSEVKIVKLFKAHSGYFIVAGDDIKTYLIDPDTKILTQWLEKHVPDNLILEYFEDKFTEF
jgi:hypothetical protein